MNPANPQRPLYVLVTPARNEAATLETTIRSVLAQTALPAEWIIVSDRSTDDTDHIVARYSALHPWIRLVQVQGGGDHSFAAVVRATERGLASLSRADYAFLGLLDADVRFAPDYFERLLLKFREDPQLGLAGGLVQDVGTTAGLRSFQNLNEVAGAAQFFRRECLEAIGRLLPIPEGGWDAITCLRARMVGYRTATFPDLPVDHLKPRNVSQGGAWRRACQLGVRDYALGYHPLFMLAKCCSRVSEPPFLLGSLGRLAGFSGAALRNRQRLLSPDLVRYIRREQLRRLNPFAALRSPGSTNGTADLESHRNSRSASKA